MCPRRAKAKAGVRGARAHRPRVPLRSNPGYALRAYAPRQFHAKRAAKFKGS